MKPEHPPQHGTVTAAASAYLLLMLLQRIEAEQRGTIARMIEGVEADRAAAAEAAAEESEDSAASGAHAVADAVFSEALSILRRASIPYGQS